MSKPLAIRHTDSGSKKTTSTPDTVTSKDQTAAQYIYNSMRDTTQPPEMRPTLRKMSSIDKSSNRSLGLLSMDMFPEDIELRADLTGGLLSLQADSKRSINSSDFVKGAFLSETSLSGRDLKHGSGEPLPSSRSPILGLAAKLERITTGDDIIGENIRLNSSEWMKDFEENEMIPMGPMPQSMFYESAPSIPPVVSAPAGAVNPANEDSFGSSPVPNYVASSSSQYHSLPQLSLATDMKSTKSERKTSKLKKKRKRIIDETTSCEPNDNDVLFGRGGFTNNRPGNIHFRQEALRLRPWYEQSTKEEKYEISNILLESVKSRGGRFLEKGSDGKWHEVIGNGARRKASQALRERIKSRAASVLNSSLTPMKSKSGEERDDVTEILNCEV